MDLHLFWMPNNVDIKPLLWSGFHSSSGYRKFALAHKTLSTNMATNQAMILYVHQAAP